MAQTAAELIAHLEQGGLIATGDPDHIQMLRFEMWESGGRLHKHLGVYGFGSAGGQAQDRLLRVLEEPYRWVMVPACRTAPEMEALAAVELQKIHEPDPDATWRLILKAGETRGPNVKNEEEARDGG